MYIRTCIHVYTVEYTCIYMYMNKQVPFPYPDSPIPGFMLHGDRSCAAPDDDLPPISEEATPSPMHRGHSLARRTYSEEVSISQYIVSIYLSILSVYQ